MSKDSGGGAIGVIAAMGIVYWIATGIAVVVVISYIGTALAGILILRALLWFLSEAEKPSLGGWLAFLASGVVLLSGPIVLALHLQGPSDGSFGLDDMLSLACFFGFIGAVLLWGAIFALLATEDWKDVVKDFWSLFRDGF